MRRLNRALLKVKMNQILDIFFSAILSSLWVYYNLMAAYKIQKHNQKKNAIRIVRKRVKQTYLERYKDWIYGDWLQAKIKHSVWYTRTLHW